MAAALEVRNVSKVYRLGSRRNSLRELASAFRRKERDGTSNFAALRDVSFSVDRGSALGIIGRNGAGKTTLLKILARITRPSRGSVNVKGRLASLIALGAGFHPELTGRENIFLNGAILGVTQRQLRSRFHDIVDFAGLEEFIDTPVKRYSSGMYARLGFSVAVHSDPEILLVDEVLSVGDSAFQQRSVAKMVELVGGGRTTVFVSHNLFATQSLCDRVIWLNDGQIQSDGPPGKAINDYMDWVDVNQLKSDSTHLQSSHAGDALTVNSVVLRDSTGARRDEFRTNEDLTVEVEYEAAREIERPYLTIGVNHGRQGSLFYATMFIDGPGPDKISGKGVISCTFAKAPMLPGVYQIWLEINENGKFNQLLRWRMVSVFRVVTDEKMFPPDALLDQLRNTGSLYVPHKWSWSAK